MLKALQKSYPNASAIYIQHKDIAYPRIVIKSNLSLFIRIPLTFSSTHLQDFITQNHLWIQSTLNKIHTQHLALESTLHTHTNQIPIFGTWHDINLLFNIDKNKTQKMQLKEILGTYIKIRTNEYATLMGLKYRSIKITNALSRFGSCSSDNRLCFSLMLIFAKKELIDYVIIHELAHILHKNHSRAFWDFVIEYCADAKALRKLLRKEARIYPLLLEKIT